MNDNKTNIHELKEIVKKFIEERDWKQFHTPSNITKSIIIEAAELLEKFQWLDGKESTEFLESNKQEIEEELADVFSYILSLCVFYNIDLSSSLTNKMELNRKKYPMELVSGKYDKYTKYKQNK